MRPMTALVLIADTVWRSICRSSGRVGSLLGVVVLLLSVGAQHMLFEIPQSSHRNHHPECGHRKRYVNINSRLYDLHHDRRRKRTDINTHVKDVVGAILEVTALR